MERLSIEYIGHRRDNPPTLEHMLYDDEKGRDVKETVHWEFIPHEDKQVKNRVVGRKVHPVIAHRLLRQDFKNSKPAYIKFDPKREITADDIRGFNASVIDPNAATLEENARLREMLKEKDKELLALKETGGRQAANDALKEQEAREEAERQERIARSKALEDAERRAQGVEGGSSAQNVTGSFGNAPKSAKEAEKAKNKPQAPVGK